MTRADITRLTKRLGDEIGRVYGWDFPIRQPQREESEVKDMGGIDATKETF